MAESESCLFYIATGGSQTSAGKLCPEGSGDLPRSNRCAYRGPGVLENNRYKCNIGGV